MDMFIEKIVRKKKTAFDRIVAVFIFLFSLGVVFTVPFILRGIGLLISIGVLYAAYKILISFNIEYEYSVTNNFIDIDKIINQRKRKKVYSGDCKDFELVAKKNSSKYNSAFDNIPQKIPAVSSMQSDDIYFIVTNNEKGRLIIYFEPDDRMLESFRKYIPSKVFISN